MTQLLESQTHDSEITNPDLNNPIRDVFRTLKRAALGASKAVGVFRRVQDSDWRRRRLVVLCYHGVSLDDEHRWRPSLYVRPETLRARFDILRDGGYSVLPLNEAIDRLYADELPSRSVAITFDDGYHDFYECAFPLLRAYGFPATVYLTTQACGVSYPRFRLVCAYLLWKARGIVVDAGPLVGAGMTLDLRTEAGRDRACEALVKHVRPLNRVQKHEFARELGGLLGLDYGHIAAKRVLTIMTPAEVAELSAEGVDIQLHTHRHWAPTAWTEFAAEINENRRRIEEMTGRRPRHFCYPSGDYRPQHLPWLAELGVVSATTCDSGLASRATNPLLLPRLIDHSTLAPIEFEGWLSGASMITGRKPKHDYAAN